LIERRWLPVLAWAGTILLATSIPNPPIPRTLSHADKLTHLLLYGVLGYLLARALRNGKRRWRLILLAVAVGIAFGAADEWHQRFIAGRSSELADWGADSAGVLLGALLASLIPLRRRGLATHT
jgi:VanZ family protein